MANFSLTLFILCNTMFLSYFLGVLFLAQGVKGAKEKTEVISVRLTPDEKSYLKHLAKMAGMSVSAFVVGVCLGDKLGQYIIDGFKE